MALLVSTPSDAHLSPSPAGASFFRSDVEGLRAVAVLLVVLYHAGVRGISGGFIGVDVFFVLSGFLITSLLLRETDRGSRPSLRNFYARRARRLLPGAFLVTVTVVLTSYRWLGFLRADQIANDARWSAAFMANWRFAQIGSNYLTSTDPPSPLLHFWSLAVEEQFYLVWPGCFILVSLVLRRYSLRKRLAAVLLPVCVLSLWWSVVQTNSNGTLAFFSPLTRTWELGVGALLAVAAPALRRLPAALAPALTWCGLGTIVAAAYLFDIDTKFPGIAVVLPVGGTLLALIGGFAPHSWDANVILGRLPFQWLGRLSYSFYLWHWPLIAMFAEYHGESQSALVNCLLLVVALGVSAISFYLIESPIRFWKVLVRRPTLSILGGALLVAISVTLATWTISRHGGI